MEKICKNCKHHGKWNFCEKIVVDTKRITYEGKGVQSYYIDERVGDFDEDERFAIITPNTFSCIFYEDK